MQDKENRSTPSSAYISSRLGPASPALHTPSHPNPAQPSEHAHSSAAPNMLPSGIAHAISSPSIGTAQTHVTPSVVGNGHSTPTSAAAAVIPCTEAVLPMRAFGERAHSRLGCVAHNSVLETNCQTRAAEQLPSSEPQTQVRLCVDVATE